MSESLQWAVILPGLMLCVLGLIQTGVWINGRQVLHSAAAAAAEVEAVLGASPGSGESAARQVAGGTVVDLEVTVVRTAARVEVTVTGRVPVFFDLGQGALSAQAGAALEGTSR